CSWAATRAGASMTCGSISNSVVRRPGASAPAAGPSSTRIPSTRRQRPASGRPVTRCAAPARFACGASSTAARAIPCRPCGSAMAARQPAFATSRCAVAEAMRAATTGVAALLGEGRLLEALERGLLAAGGADEFELCDLGGGTGATRFSWSGITQSALLEEPVVQVRARIGRRIGAARGSAIDRATLAELAGRAVEYARAMPESQHQIGFAEATPLPACGPAFDEATAALDAA